MDFNSIAHYWKDSYSKSLEISKKYKNSEQFRKMANLMAPGKSYYYIANFQTLKIEMISDSVFDFIEDNKKAERPNIEFQRLLALALPEEIQKIHRKEQVIRDFFIDYIPSEKMQDYKVLYTYVLKDYKNSRRVMLHQATVLSQDSQGHFVHVFSIHTDISHLTDQSVEEVSFLNINGGTSYLNICTKSGKFEPKVHREQPKLKNQLSQREIEITKMFAQGLNAEEISSKLFISAHTVRTHRKNILKKTNSKNTTQLVSRCIAAGMIVPDI